MREKNCLEKSVKLQLAWKMTVSTVSTVATTVSITSRQITYTQIGIDETKIIAANNYAHIHLLF